MRLAPSANTGTVHLFGGTGDISRRLYALHRNGQLTIVIELPDPIIAVTDNRDAVYAATRSDIYRAAATAPELVIRLPAEVGPIASIAAPQDNKVLYFATQHRVYALIGLSAISIVNDAGGSFDSRTISCTYGTRSKSFYLALLG